MSENRYEVRYMAIPQPPIKRVVVFDRKEGKVLMWFSEGPDEDNANAKTICGMLNGERE